MVTAKIEEYNMNVTPRQYKITFINTDKSIKPIAGHRFVDLLGKNQYITDVDILLDFYGLKFVPKNIYMELGDTLEDYVVNYVYKDKGKIRFKYDEYKDCKSGAFDLDGEDIGGLPDGIIIEDNKLIEVKCTTSKFKGFKEEWKLQAQFYAYWWNKKKAKETGIKIKSVEVVKYYVPKDVIEAHIKYPSWIVGKNIKTEEYDLETDEIKKLIAKARAKKKELIDSSSFILTTETERNTLYQLKKAMNSKKLLITYDKENQNVKEIIRTLYKTKVGTRKRKVIKGRKKI